MQKDIIENESYNVSISDWITILQDKTSTHTNYYIFFASMIIGSIIVIPQMVKDSMGSNLFATLMLLLLLGLFYIIYRLGTKRVAQEYEPYKELYNNIILGEITDTKKIRDEYKKIEKKLKDRIKMI